MFSKMILATIFMTTVMAAPACTPCTNVRNGGMARKDRTCESWSDFIREDRCIKKSRWRKNKYCQLTCFLEGVGYEGDNCCVPTVPSPPPSASPTPPPSPTTPPPSASPVPSGYVFATNELLRVSVQQWCEEDETEVDAGDLDTWVTSKVTNMDDLFSDLPCNEDVSKWDVSSVTSFVDTFSDSGFKGDLSNWDTSSAKSFEYMFAYSDFNRDISMWDTSAAVIFDAMFDNTPFNQPIGSWDVGSARSMDYMFTNAKDFDQDLSRWDVREVTSMDRIFDGTALSDCNKFKIAVSWMDQTAAFPYPQWEGLTPCA